MEAIKRIVLRVWMAGLWLTSSTLLPAQSISIAEYPGASAPRGITAGPDGALWFAQANSIGRITATGTLTQYTVPTAGGFPEGITTGPDGALWFTENSQSKIGQVTTAGSFNEYPVPTAASSPFIITTGPDGALWFTEGSTNKIGQITTAGKFTEYTIPTAASAPRGIAVGPDGALWFTEQAGNQIGRITTTGTFTEYPVPSSQAGLNVGIAAGPDGALWFTEAFTNKIGRITTTGTFTEYPIPTTGSSPYDITAGPDGALWFAENVGNKIGRITTAGNFFEYPIPTASSSPGFITAGPDGALWFTETSGNNIGRITGLQTLESVVVPNGNATVAGGDTSNLPSTPVSAEFQSVFAGGQFLTPLVQNPAIGFGSVKGETYITGFTFRAAPGTGPANVILSGNIYLSTSPNYPNSAQGPLLSATLANNVGPDNTLVFSGGFTLSGAGCPGPAACPFANNLLFTTPFLYHGGSPLLVDVKATSILGAAGYFDQVDCGAPGCSVANVAASPLGTPTAADVSYGGNVTQFTFAPVPLPFFTGEESLGSGVYYLQFPDSNPFGYYNFQSSSILYHYDMGFEAFIPGSGADIYLYDFTTSHWWYTSSTLFPYLYDFSLNAWLYYFPDPNNPGRYSANPRYFSNLTTGMIVTM